MAPRVGWIKMNVDGASKGAQMAAGCGGLLRGCSGEWICGFVRKLGRCTTVKSKLWVVLTGLEVARSFNLDNIIIECDSVSVVSMLINLQVEDKSESRLLSLIRLALCHFLNYNFVHVYREGNTCADSLANFSLVHGESYTVFENPPLAILRCLYNDYVGVAYPRDILIQE
ncbi:hypothetical protein QN277_024799 [Acacia crassicarpa]|uniref:RNase H type-1 domain-containing protein n=1 Tax=Acacia crassicarpa TaxID=499986 RepID=A0AAE1JFK9_9FABA|nr:hypothetical protein QN277_024799 [Acacia crassicarpa]